MLIRLIKVLCVNAYKKPIQLDRGPFITYVPLHSLFISFFRALAIFLTGTGRTREYLLFFVCFLWEGKTCHTGVEPKIVLRMMVWSFPFFEHVLFKFASRQRCRIVTDLCYLLKTKPNVIDGSLTLAFSASVVSTVVFFRFCEYFKFCAATVFICRFFLPRFHLMFAGGFCLRN